MKEKLITSKGIPIVLGRVVGKGGEGIVYELPSFSNQVAKIYHSLPDAKKQAKLSFMAQSADPQLLNYVAWPQETLHQKNDGPIVGFMMPKVIDKNPVHMLYSPAHRKQKYPNASWAFLLCVARNIGATFQAIHARGHVIGDVNENSFLVGKDGRVTLIDSDSFQINAHGTLHFCEVGVAQFTPPELQALPSFNGLTRHTNHDNFGLALLIFHMLFGGRHPFAGVPSLKGVGEALEKDIKEFRYAYAPDNHLRGFKPPPNSIPISLVPSAIENMFYMAFTERGISTVRPSANQWVTMLEEQMRHLKKCNVNTLHLFPDHITTCPWCKLDQEGAVFFFNINAILFPSSSGFVLERVWSLIQAVPSPNRLDLPKPSDFSVRARPLPDGVLSPAVIYFMKFFSVVATLTVFFLGQWPGMPVVATGTFFWLIIDVVFSKQLREEKKHRTELLEMAEREYESLVTMAEKQAGLKGFQEKKEEFVRLCKELESLPLLETEEMKKFHSTAKERQKKKYLENCFIDSADIPGVGPMRKAALRSFGIETAADVSRNRIMQIRGFGEKLSREVENWKNRCERSFVFNPAVGVTEEDRNNIRLKYASKRASIENRLAVAPMQLSQYSQQAQKNYDEYKGKLRLAALKLAQAKINHSIV